MSENNGNGLALRTCPYQRIWDQENIPDQIQNGHYLKKGPKVRKIRQRMFEDGKGQDINGNSFDYVPQEIILDPLLKGTYGEISVKGQGKFNLGLGLVQRDGDGYKIILGEKEEFYLDNVLTPQELDEIDEHGFGLEGLASIVIEWSGQRDLSQKESNLLKIARTILNRQPEKRRDEAFDRI